MQFRHYRMNFWSESDIPVPEYYKTWHTCVGSVTNAGRDLVADNSLVCMIAVITGAMTITSVTHPQFQNFDF